MSEALKAKVYNRKLGWQFVGATTQGDKLPKWKHDYWRVDGQRTGRSVTLLEPLYGKEKSAAIYEGTKDGDEFCYAFSEFTPGVFGFYVAI